MTPITCPNPSCKAVTQYPDGFVAFNRGADEFCSVCDTPLFWESNPNAVAANGTGSEQSRRRLPGTGPAGQSALGSRACPACRERNTLKATHCFRCGADMNPPPPPLPKIVVAPQPVAIFVEPPRDRTLLLLLVGVVLVAAIMALLLWLGR